MNRENSLEELHLQYDQEWKMLRGVAGDNGYHTNLPAGAPVHPTVSAAAYAALLMASGKAENVTRAEDILDVLFKLQITDPANHTFGIWPWYAEEPVYKMKPPDFNWADFIGIRLAYCLKAESSHRLSDDIMTRLKNALLMAAWSIFRRNVGPEYTNITAMGAAVTGIVGEFMGIPLLLEYGAKRLRNLIDDTKKRGNFNEFNSPTYIFVALSSFEYVLDLVDDKEMRRLAEELRFMTWEMIGKRWHSATGQLAGPHSRAYSDLMFEKQAKYVSKAVGVELGAYNNTKEEQISFETRRACPESLKAIFVDNDKWIVDTLTENMSEIVNGYTWIKDDASLGCASVSSFWIQARPLIAYWKNIDNHPAILRLRMLKDGKDFSSGGVSCIQDHNKALTAIRFFNDLADHHIHMYRPEDGIFHLSELVCRWELIGGGARVNEFEGGYELQAGDYKAVVYIAPGSFNGGEIQWRSGISETKCAYVEAVLYKGPSYALTVNDDLQIELASAVEILPFHQKPTAGTPQIETRKDIFNINWEKLNLTIPLKPVNFYKA